MPRVVRFAEILQDRRAQRDVRLAARHALEKRLHRARMAVDLSQVTAAAKKRAYFSAYGLKKDTVIAKKCRVGRTNFCPSLSRSQRRGNRCIHTR